MSLLKTEMVTRMRYTLTAPFSTVSAAKKRWYRQGPAWEARGIAQSDLRRKAYIIPDTGAICITVSKCANTTLKFMLAPDAMTPRMRVHRNDHMLTRLIDGGLTLDDLLDGSHKLFTFSRNPISRFWSAYSKLADAAPGSVHAQIAKAMAVPIDAEFSPQLLLDYVRSIPVLDVDEHLRPQWSCTGMEKLPINFIGRVETMTADLRKLLDMGYISQRQMDRYGHLNPSEARDIPDKARIDNVIRDVYAKDFELFGYD